MKKITPVLWAALFALISVALQAQTPGEMWDIKATMEMPGLGTMPGMNSQACLPKGQMSEKAVQSGPRSDDCKMTSFKTTGTKTNFTMECKEATATGEIISDGKSFEQTMKMKIKQGGQVQDMTMHSTGKNTGKACDADEMKKKVAAIAQQSESVSLKVCTDNADKLDMLIMYKSIKAGDMMGGVKMTQDIPAVCASQKSVYCAATIRTIGSMNNADTFLKVAQNGVPLEQQTWAQASEFCGGPNANTVVTQACANGVKSKNWKMVGDYCNADSKTLLAANCTGRDYTSMNENTRNMCVALRGNASAGNDQADDSAPTRKAAAPKAAPEIPAIDAVKEGTKALRGLFGF